MHRPPKKFRRRYNASFSETLQGKRGIEAPILGCTMSPKYVPTLLSLQLNLQISSRINFVTAKYKREGGCNTLFLIQMRPIFRVTLHELMQFVVSLNIDRAETLTSVHQENVEMKLYFMEMDIESEPTLTAFS